MAIALDNSASVAQSTGTTAASATLSYTVNTAGSDLYVQVHLVSTTATATVTYGSNAMIQVGTTVNNGFVSEQTFYLLNVPAGTANIVVTKSAAVYHGIAAHSFKGTANAAPEVIAQTSGTSTTPTNSLTTLSVGDALLDAVSFASSATAGSSSVTASSSQTIIPLSIFSGAAFRGAVAGYRIITTAASYTDSYTISASEPWIHNMYAIASATPFPNLVQSVATGFSTSVTSMAVTLPAPILSGNLLLAAVEVRNSGTFTAPTGWTALFSPVAAGGVGGFSIFYHIADGTETTTATWTASVATTASWQTALISNWNGTTIPEAANANSAGAVSTNNPPSLAPSWGSDNTLWLAIMGTTADGTTITAAPTNYLGFSTNSASSGGSQAGTGLAYRQLNAASEDPGGFTTSSDRWWVAATVAIPPTGGTTTTTTTVAPANTGQFFAFF